MAPNNRSRKEPWAREPTVSLGVVQIRKRAIGDRFVEPGRHAVQDLGADFLRCDGGGFEFPVGFRVQVSAIERESVFLHY